MVGHEPEHTAARAGGSLQPTVRLIVPLAPVPFAGTRHELKRASPASHLAAPTR